jgi:superfamily II DNA or RNA helicase
MKFLDVSKDERQEESVQRWLAYKGRARVIAVPRFGKTNIGIKIFNKIYKVKGDKRMLVVTPSEIITNHWKANLKATCEYDGVEVCSISWLINNIKSVIENPVYLTVFDETHKYTTDERYKAFSELCINSKFILGLSGSDPVGEEKGLLDKYMPVCDRITEQEAKENNWISDFIEYNLLLDFSKEDQQRYAKFSEFISEMMNQFKGVHYKLVLDDGYKLFDDDLSVIYSCHSGRKVKGGYITGGRIREFVAKRMGWSVNLDMLNDNNRSIDAHWSPNNLYERCKQFKDFVKKRNDLINSNPVKLAAILKIIERNPVPTIVFNESTSFCNIVADSIGKDAVAYHSNIKSRPIFDKDNDDFIRYQSGAKEGQPRMFGSQTIKNDAIKGIETGQYKYLITVKALDEGLDLPNLEQVIATAGTQNPIQHVQRTARGKTIDSDNTDKLCIIVNLVFDDFTDATNNLVRSRDKQKLITRQKYNEHSVVWVSNIDDIFEK